MLVPRAVVPPSSPQAHSTALAYGLASLDYGSLHGVACPAQPTSAPTTGQPTAPSIHESAHNSCCAIREVKVVEMTMRSPTATPRAIPAITIHGSYILWFSCIFRWAFIISSTSTITILYYCLFVTASLSGCLCRGVWLVYLLLGHLRTR